MSFLVTVIVAIALLIGIFLIGLIGTWLVEHLFGLGK
jgi:hypothetical protein